jgi:hypothetical protein
MLARVKLKEIDGTPSLQIFHLLLIIPGTNKLAFYLLKHSKQLLLGYATRSV